MALARMRRDRRMVVTGCAGSGKTTLAAAHAKRLARDGARVLFACFNRGLGDHLRERERTHVARDRTKAPLRRTGLAPDDEDQLARARVRPPAPGDVPLGARQRPRPKTFARTAASP